MWYSLIVCFLLSGGYLYSEKDIGAANINAIIDEVQKINKAKCEVTKYYYMNTAGGEVILKVYRNNANKIKKVLYSCFEGGAVERYERILEYYNEGVIIYACYSVFQTNNVKVGNVYFSNGRPFYHMMTKKDRWDLLLDKNNFVVDDQFKLGNFQVPNDSIIYTYNIYHKDIKAIERHELFLKNTIIKNEPIKKFQITKYAAQLRTPGIGEETYISQNNVIVRSGPGMKHNDLYRLEAQDRVKIIEISNGKDDLKDWGCHNWFKVDLLMNSRRDDKRYSPGWIFGAFLSPIEDVIDKNIRQ